MLYSLDMAPISKASSRGKWHAFWHKVWGQEPHLHDLALIKNTARRIPTKKSAVILVPLDKIIGSEGRVQDFDHDFHPLSDHNDQRWINVAVAHRNGITLPPVDLIQVGDEYYVRDGHHRVSVAKANGQKEIEARIHYALAS